MHFRKSAAPKRNALYNHYRRAKIRRNIARKLNNDHSQTTHYQTLRASKSVTSLSSDFWGHYYDNQHTPWDAGKITTPLKKYLDQLPDKTIRILIPGCGNAHEAEYLSNQGFTQVFVCDWASQALHQFQKRVPQFPASHLLLSDYFKLHGSFDLILEQTFLCALPHPLHEAYSKKTYDLLKPGGHLAGLLFKVITQTGPPFGRNLKQYRALFEPIFDKVKIEPCYNSIKPREGLEFFIIMKKNPVK